MLLSGSKKESIRLLTPKGMELTLAVEDICLSPDCVRCAIRKDSGDDPDITRDTLIYAEVRKTETVGIVIDGGQGVGRVTKPGLDQPVGAAAINSVPRLMIREAVEEVCGLFGYTGGLYVMISAPDGETLAKKTFNPRLGIIEGASDGAGLGHDFLRHIDRCRLLVHLVDVSGSEGRDPVEDFEAINAELRAYSDVLGSRMQIVAANKCDLLGDDRTNIDRLRAHVEAQGYAFFEMSAAAHTGTRELVQACAAKLAEIPPVPPYEADYVPPEPEVGTSDELQIRHFDDLWVVEGPWLQRLMGSINFGDYESRMYFDRVLRQSGLFDRLEAMGIEEGDTVSIYDLDFEFRF